MERSLLFGGRVQTRLARTEIPGTARPKVKPPPINDPLSNPIAFSLENVLYSPGNWGEVRLGVLHAATSETNQTFNC